MSELSNIDHYVNSDYSFIPHYHPNEAIGLPTSDTLRLLIKRWGKEAVQRALDPSHTVDSPAQTKADTQWIKKANVAGINVRTIGSFWNVVKYTLTLPQAHDAIHLLPIWEPGVVGSLYGMASWHINPEFFSEELQAAIPELDTVEQQLKVVINLLHLMGRAVGFDAIPHTDRYSEIVLANPSHFEWLQRKGDRIIAHNDRLHEAVERAVWQFLQQHGPASDSPTLLANSPGKFFDDNHYPEAERCQLLFGTPRDYDGRGKRRGLLVQHLFSDGYEPVPATMGPPYRGLEVDPDENTVNIDSEGRDWREYRITKPQEMSRVFGPLTRYKLYGRLDDNREWEIDFDEVRKPTWAYIARHFSDIQARYHFDFMRGDMSHVQMRPTGVPDQVGPHYDFHGFLKEHIRRRVPYFAYFAETFLTGPGFMAYGNEVDHLENAQADVTLGDLQSRVPGSEVFLANLRWYLDLLGTRTFAPSFTLMTGDKDDPRFDQYYLHGNEARYFAALFLPDIPSYMGLGFECRDPHPEPAPNEYYSKLYVFQIEHGSRAVNGPYRFGSNESLFRRLTRVRLLAESLLPRIQNKKTHWLLPPDPTGGFPVVAWTQQDSPSHLFVLNFGDQEVQNIRIPLARLAVFPEATCLFSTHTSDSAALDIRIAPLHFYVRQLEAGEGRAYRVSAE